MMKEWATVISWHQGVALLRCEASSGCAACSSREGCGTRILNKLGPQAEHLLQVDIAQPLQPGQRIEIGISEGSLLRSALLVYMTPLLGLMLGGAAMQWMFSSDPAAIAGALLGGTAGFMLAKNLAERWGVQHEYQLVVLQIGLPPDILRPQQAGDLSRAQASR